MNPFEEYRRRYIALCFAVAAIYAFSLGGNIYAFPERMQVTYSILDTVVFCITNGLVYGAMLCLMGIILWNIFRFAIPTTYTPRYRFIFIAILAVLTCLFVAAIESFAIYLCFPSAFRQFAYSIPARLLVTLLLFAIIRMFYVYFDEKRKGNTTSKETILEETNSEDSKLEDPTTSDKSKSPIDRITVRSGQKIIIISIDEILFIKADGDYISINTDKGSWLKEQTMKYTENTLPAKTFVRIHRSYIVNVNYISRIERYGEKQLIILHNGEKIKISAARYQVLKLVLGL